jgi:ABC-2 type transport system permease protein
MWRDNLRSMYYIALKDMRTYYLKPPAISWGLVFPVVWILAFYLRNPRSFEELIPGLIAMTILFSTTAAEAVVINFELRIGSLERLLTAPVSFSGVLLGKILGGAIFGLIMTTAVTAISISVFGIHPHVGYLVLFVILSVVTFSALGAMISVSVKEVFEAQTLLNLPRFIMVFVSGVIYPVTTMPTGLQYFARVLPLTYTVSGIRQSLESNLSTAPFNALALVGFLGLFTALAIKLFRRRFA